MAQTSSLPVDEHASMYWLRHKHSGCLTGTRWRNWLTVVDNCGNDVHWTAPAYRHQSLFSFQQCVYSQQNQHIYIRGRIQRGGIGVGVLRYI